MELMIESLDGNEIANSAPIAPRFLERPVDLVHLARYTLGDGATEHEVLSLFRTQSQFLLRRLRTCSDQALRRQTVKTLKASARGIGAWRVAAAADQALRLDGVLLLEHRVEEANRFIGALLASA